VQQQQQQQQQQQTMMQEDEEEAAAVSSPSQRASIRQHALSLLARLRTRPSSSNHNNDGDNENGEGEDEDEDLLQIDYGDIENHRNKNKDGLSYESESDFSHVFRSDVERSLSSDVESYYTTDDYETTDDERGRGDDYSEGDSHQGRRRRLEEGQEGKEQGGADYRENALKLLDRVGEYGVVKNNHTEFGVKISSTTADDKIRINTMARTAKISDAGLGKGEQRRRRKGGNNNQGSSPSNNTRMMVDDNYYDYDVSTEYAKYEERKIHPRHSSRTHRLLSSKLIKTNRNAFNDGTSRQLLLIVLLSMFLAGVVYFWL